MAVNPSFQVLQPKIYLHPILRKSTPKNEKSQFSEAKVKELEKYYVLLAVFQDFFVPLQTKHQEQSLFANSPTEHFYVPRWPRYDVEDNVKLQKQRKMEKNLLSQFASQFAEASLTSLVESFNAQVGNRGFNSARAAHDHALLDELVRRGVDVSAISDGHSISFAHNVALDEAAMKLVFQG